MTSAAAPDGIAVVVVTHRSASTIGACLDALARADGIAEVVVVDNASDDATLATLDLRRDAAPRFELLRNATNAGFAAACNQGAARARAPWLAFLNPDCLVEPGTLAAMRAVALADPSVGLVGADVRDAAGTAERAARRREPDWRGALRRVFGDRDALAWPTPPDAEATHVEAVSGALMLAPRALFDALGGFDEGYVLHCEDLDLCRRVRDAGRVVVVAERARARHLQGVSSRRRPIWVAWQKHRGMRRYFRKHQRAGVATPLAWLVEAGIWLRFALSLPALAWRAWIAPRR